ncbi:sulfotransferase family protein [Limibacter armeniacum]|uniref:sulfotransferase family protein n=1 Tax=Limibacter armeniacum TaxID=466084 RepID=UPI002FE5F617
MNTNKVIGVGFHKTGTSTLGAALTNLGYNVADARVDLAQKLISGDISYVLSVADMYDAYEDNPWALLYKELDDKYPKSKFILTLRDEGKWIKSVLNHFDRKHSDMREWIYGKGSPKGNELVYLKKYRQHNNEVISYFKGREDDLLIVNWEEGSEWSDLCNFLNKPIPNISFPHANKGKYRKGGGMFFSYFNK